MALPELTMSFSDVEALRAELDNNLKLGRSFIKDASGVEVLSDCSLVLVHPVVELRLTLSAHAVMVADAGPMIGVGIELRPFDETVIERIERFVAGEADDSAQLPPPSDAEQRSGDDEAVAEEMPSGPESEHPSGRPPKPADVQQISAHERLRKLNSTEQHKVARTGELSDRVALERMYGKNVWEALLKNPRLTIPEVARIARKGTVPKPLLELIVENGSWCRASPVRRALLSNNRIGSDSVLKLLRATPKHELKIIVKGSTYSMQVRDAAKKLL